MTPGRPRIPALRLPAARSRSRRGAFRLARSLASLCRVRSLCAACSTAYSPGQTHGIDTLSSSPTAATRAEPRWRSTPRSPSAPLRAPTTASSTSSPYSQGHLSYSMVTSPLTSSSLTAPLLRRRAGADQPSRAPGIPSCAGCAEHGAAHRQPAAHAAHLKDNAGVGGAASVPTAGSRCGHQGQPGCVEVRAGPPSPDRTPSAQAPART